MARERRLELVIAGDASGAQRALQSVDSETRGMSDRMREVGRRMSLAVTLPVAAAGAAIFNMAGDMNETVSMVDTIFGRSASRIQDWSQTTATSMGLARSESLQAVGTFGNLFTQLGIGTDQAADMSMQLTSLASDFASFHNAAPTDVIEAMTAGFRGEYDALQRFVPTINAAAVEQKALEMGLAATTAEIDDQDRALAVQALMIDGAGAALGDFSRTSDSAANRQRILTARFRDAATELGQNLMPIGERILGWVSTLAEKFNDLSPGVQQAILVAAGLAAAIGPLITVVGGLSTAIGFLAANPIVLLVAAIAGLVIVVVRNWDTIKAAFHTAVEFIKGVLSAVGRWIADNWHLILAPLTGGISIVVRQIIDNWDGIVGFVRGLPGRIASAASGMWDGIKNAFRAALNWIIDRWNGLEFRVPGFNVGPVHFGGFTLGVPDIPRLHTGGIFRAPTAGGEGLALLKDRERVLPPGASARGEATVRYVGGPTDELGRAIWAWIQKNVRVEFGGDVQAALGS